MIISSSGVMLYALLTASSTRPDTKPSSDLIATRPTVCASATLVAPSTIESEQLYYWRQSWQSDQAKAVVEIETGQAILFRSADEIVQWLNARQSR